MTTEAVAEAPAAKKTLSPERLAKMQAGAKRAAEDRAAKKAAPSDVDARLAAQDEKLAAIMAMLGKLTAAPTLAAVPAVEARSVGGVKTADATSAEAPLVTTRAVEAVYLVMARVGPTRARVNLRVTDPEDERWEGEFLRPPFNGDPRGALEVATVTRVDGEVYKSVDICGGPCHLNVARGFLRQFAAAKAAGAAKPWDVEHWYRDQKAETDRLKREGKVEEALLTRQLLIDALKGIVDFKKSEAA